MDHNIQEIKSIDDKGEVESTMLFLNSIRSHKINKEIWEWEFESFPNETVSTVFKDKTKVVGTQFMLPIKLMISEIELLTGKCENSYFNDDYRGKGLFQKLFSFAEELSVKKKMAFLWAFTPATKVYEQKLGFTVFPKVMYNFSLKVGKPQLSFLRTYNTNLGLILLKYLYQMLNYSIYRVRFFLFKIKVSQINLKYDVSNTPKSFEDINMLYDKIKLRLGDFAHLKIDNPYFNWRISNNVNLKYKTSYFYKDNKLVGYYIFSLNNYAANISDFTSSNPETSEVMISHLLSSVSKLGILTLNYFGNIENRLNSSNFKLFRNFGGRVKVNEGMPFVFKNIIERNAVKVDLMLPRNWYLNGLWTEGFNY